ncbi:MAG: VWA domain-containing protein, partial [Devosia sp.]
MGKAAPGPWRHFGAVLLGLLLLAAPSVAGAACQPQNELETTLGPEDAAGGWCITGSVASRAEPHLHFRLPVAGLWRVRIEALPGQTALALLAAEGANGSRQIWQGATSRSGGPATSPSLFLAAGPYSLAVSAADASLVYRLFLESGPPSPPELARPVTDSFSGVLHGTDEKNVIPWTIGQASADTLWTVSAQGSVGLSMSLALLDAAGNTVLSTSSSDQAGVFRLPDLLLPKGAYQLIASGLPAGAPILLSAAEELRPADFANEPDGQPDQAHQLQPSRPVTGRLVTDGTYGEHDDFVLMVPAGPGAPGYDVILSAPSSDSLSLALLADDGSVVVQRDGARQVALRSLRLSPGRHVFQVSGALPVDVSYTLQVSEIGPPVAGFEIEPNDVRSGATALPASGVIAGDFNGDDKDFLDLTVAGGLELWDIEAIGEGITSLDLYDGAGQIIATASPARTTPLVNFSHLLLPPGHNVLRLAGASGKWLLNAKRIGPPIDGEEIEPDDDPTRALFLIAGRSQRGWLERQDDRDVYAFHIGAPQRVTLALDSPAELAVKMRLSWGDARDQISEPTTTGASGEPQQLRWDAMLQPGDYFIELSSIGGISRQPYTLRLDLPSYFSRPLDLEPNDTDLQAAALPAGQQLVGVLQGDQDADWYVLDPAFGTGPLRVRADTIGRSLSLQLENDAVPAEVVQRIDFYQAGETSVLKLPPGRRLLRVTGVAGPYSINLGENRALPVLSADATLSFEPGPVAAYEPLAQRLNGQLSVHNIGSGPLTLHLSSWVGDERWRFDGLPDKIVLEPAETATVPLALEISPDARDDFPVYAEVALTQSTRGPVATARAMVPVSTGVLPVMPHPFEPLPAAMLGGLDLASSAFGAIAVDPAWSGLIDGMVNIDGVSLGLADRPVIRLAGERDVPVAGVILQPPPGGSAAQRLADFAVEVSLDGANFTRVLTARLSPIAREQAFVLPPATVARAVRLVPLSAQGGPPIDRARLAEFEVIATPDFLTGEKGFDIGSPVLGGHIVSAAGFGQQELTGDRAAWPGDRPVLSPADRTASPQWAIGFLDGRSASVATLTWHERSDTPPEQRIENVEVFAGAAGPLGPWVSLGRWQVGASTDETLVLAMPVWARALSFRVVDPTAGPLALPASIEIRESPGPSILGAWGDLNPAGPYDAQASRVPDADSPPRVSGDPLAPTVLAVGDQARGAVKLGQSEAWYDVEVPEGTRVVRAQFAGALAPEVSLVFVGADGTEIPMEPDAEAPATLSAAIGPGRWRLHVTQPRGSVAIAWDTSGSVSALYPVVARMIRQLAWQLDPEREQINLVPFRGEASSFLMPDWSGSRADVFSALSAYPLNDSSSDAENALLFSVSKLADRVGRRAVVLVTDASYSDVYTNEQLWKSFERARVGVFALYLPADTDPRRVRAQTNLMSDWAGEGGGQLSRFADQGDSQIAFRRVQAWLDRPARFSFALSADTTPPKPGRFAVQLGDQAAPTAPSGQHVVSSPVAMDIIFDASGSMLQSLGASRKIDIAKEVLINVGKRVLPANLPVALRVFGHDRPNSCESELLIPLSPLDRDTFVSTIERVQSINLARTSIASSLRQAGQDLAGAAGPKIIVLVTDGEETCGGDPLAEINRLRGQGVDVKLNIVGFAVNDAKTRSLLQSWAVAGGGAYFDASDGAALGAATTAATELSYSVFDKAGKKVAQGVVGDAAIELP